MLICETEGCSVKLNQESSQAIFKLMQGMSAYLPMPVYWIDLDGVVQGGNDLACALSEFSSEKIVGKTLFDLYPDQAANLITRHNLEVIRTGQILNQEFTLQDEDETSFEFSALKIPLQDRHGNIAGIIVSPNHTSKLSRFPPIAQLIKPVSTLRCQ
jgi:PAS domain-containing protein